MMVAIAFFVVIAILRCASAANISTSLLLPSGLFYPEIPLQPPTFVGQVTVTRSTTYYTVECNAGVSAALFNPGFGGPSYTFSENSASTQYIHQYDQDYAEPSAAFSSGAAPSTLDQITLTGTINCGPLGAFGSAACTSTNTDDEDNTSYATTPESSLYPVTFTIAEGYSVASSTAGTSAAPSPTSSAPTAKPTTTTTTTAHPSLGPSSKVGIGLGVPFGACALAGVALLLYRHGKHKERSRLSQMGNLAPLGGFTSGTEGKKMSEAGVDSQMLGRQPPVYSMEMQG